MAKEVIIVFENQKLEFDLETGVKVGQTTITNEDETLILTVNGTKTNINTNVIQRYENNYSFPNRGKENVLYIDTTNQKIYYWLNGSYQLLSEYEEPTIIYGGDANGGKNIRY